VRVCVCVFYLHDILASGCRQCSNNTRVARKSCNIRSRRPKARQVDILSVCVYFAQCACLFCGGECRRNTFFVCACMCATCVSAENCCRLTREIFFLFRERRWSCCVSILNLSSCVIDFFVWKLLAELTFENREFLVELTFENFAAAGAVARLEPLLAEKTLLADRVVALQDRVSQLQVE